MKSKLTLSLLITLALAVDVASTWARSPQSPAPATHVASTCETTPDSTVAVTEIRLDHVSAGSKTVTGRYFPADARPAPKGSADNTASFDSIKLDVVSGPSTMAAPVQALTAATLSTDDNGFSVTFASPLAETQSVHAHAFKGGCELLLERQNDTVVQSLGFDWGRARAYASAGIVLDKSATSSSATSNSSSASSPSGFSNSGYFSFDTDFLVFWIGKGSTKPAGVSYEKDEILANPCRVLPTVKRYEDGGKGSSLSSASLKKLKDGCRTISITFLNDTLRTSLRDAAEDVASSLQKIPAPWRASLNTYGDFRLTQIPVATSSSNSTSQPSTNSSASSSTISILQATGGYVELGVYLPIFAPAAQWTFFGQEDGVFIAPLAKAGWQGFASDSSIYHFWGTGTRIGFVSFPAKPGNKSPKIISFLDVTTGKWDNFHMANGHTGNRLDVTGTFTIPETPIFVGFDSNTGAGPKDLSFLAGIRVDVASLLSKLIPTAK